MSSSANCCTHKNLRTDPHHSAQYTRPSPSLRAAAATPSGAVKQSITDSRAHKLRENEFKSTFPGPLVLPNDDLDLDPKYPAQSLRSWIRSRDRNKVEDEGGRRVIYVVGPPKIDEEGVRGFMKGWTDVRGVGEVKGEAKEKMGEWVGQVVEYLQAFYHGLPVKQMDPEILKFVPWDDNISAESSIPSAEKSDQPSYVGLRTTDQMIGIQQRVSPSNKIHPRQLNLNDLLDVAITILPSDAYALIMLVDQDLYEDDEDEFVCGRAYGGSRVAVVSRARYNPALDERQGVTRDHAWPASCCEDYVSQCCDGLVSKKKGKLGVDKECHFAIEGSPLEMAVTRHSSLPSLENCAISTLDPKVLAGLWLSRVCRTASHELGHCFGIDHCVYYACCMQGSASILEDARQPPYLCPVDLAKVERATGMDGDGVERYRALLRFCERFEDVQFFVAFEAWIKPRLDQLEKRAVE